METMHPAPKNGRNVWDHVNMPESEFQARVERVRAVSQVYRDLFDGARESGLEPLSDYGLGNGIGLSLNESPVISERGGQRLKEGMCLALRVAVHDKTFGNVMIGSTLLVGKNGVEVVT